MVDQGRPLIHGKNVCGGGGCPTYEREWNKLKEKFGMRQLPAIARAVFCGSRPIIISSIFANPGIYETIGKIICNVKMGPNKTPIF